MLDGFERLYLIKNISAFLFSSGRTTFISRFNAAKKGKSKVGESWLAVPDCLSDILGVFRSPRTLSRVFSYLACGVNPLSHPNPTAALKAEIFPLSLHTSAGSVLLNVYDSTLHAKGQSACRKSSLPY